MHPRQVLALIVLLSSVAASLTGCGTSVWMIVDPTFDVAVIAPGTKGRVMVPADGQLVMSKNKVPLGGLAVMKLTEEEWDEILGR